jgi:hypothetical protein
MWECTHTLSLSLSKNILLYYSSLMKIDDDNDERQKLQRICIFLIFCLTFF